MNTLHVLEEVAVRQPVGVSELARVTGMPKSSVQRCLVTLQEAGWLRQAAGDRSLRTVTTRPLTIRLRAAGEEALREAALPIMEDLRRTTNETVYLMVRAGDELIAIARCDSTQAVRTFVEIGTRAPLYGTASGMAILARSNDAEVAADLIGRELVGYTETSIVDKSRLREEVAAIRERGYAVNPGGWWRDHVSTIAPAIPGESGKAIATITISMPTIRFDQSAAERFGTAVARAAESIARVLEP